MEFRDLGRQYLRIREDVDAGIANVLGSSRFILGPQVRELEAKLADYVGVKHCVSCANGTDALQLALMAWGIGPGDAVFTSDFTFFASAGAASILGASPVLVDIDPRTFNICPDALEAAIQKVLAEGKLTPKVILPVDLFGLPANYPRIGEIAKRYGLRVLEDGAQGFGGASGPSGTRRRPPSSPPSRWAATATAARSSRTTARWPNCCAPSGLRAGRPKISMTTGSSG